MAAGADGGDLDAVPKLDVPPWMALAQFVPLLHRLANVLTVRPYLRVTIRLQTGGEPVERSYLGVCLLHLARHPPVHGRVQLVTDRCETCGLPELLIGA